MSPGREVPGQRGELRGMEGRRCVGDGKDKTENGEQHGELFGEGRHADQRELVFHTGDGSIRNSEQEFKLHGDERNEMK